MSVGRIVAGIAGGCMIVYFVGGTIGNAVAAQLHWQTLLVPAAGVLLGILLIGYALWGARSVEGKLLGRALLSGLLAAAIGVVPGFLLLAAFFEGVLPHLLTALVVIPGLFVAGALLGGIVASSRSRQAAQTSSPT